LKSEIKVNLSWENQFRRNSEKAGGNDTVPISVWRGEEYARCTKCCCCSWLFVKFFVLNKSVQPRVRVFCSFLLNSLSLVRELLILLSCSTGRTVQGYSRWRKHYFISS